jgi:hypothetical protein
MYRFFKLSWSSGVLLVLPILLGAGWYAWSAFASLDRYVRAADGKQKLSLTLYQIALHDEIERDLRRMNLPARPDKGQLPTYQLYLSRASIDSLNEGRARELESSYVKGSIKLGGEVREVEVRYRGSAHWHWIGMQKSLKVKLENDELLNDTRVFNLLNESSPFGLEQQIILGIAREEGLLAPEYYPVWLRLNNSDLGVYRYEAQPDEGLLRRNRRMPGSLYSGDSDAVDRTRGVGALFFDRAGWTKVAWKTDAEKENFREIDRLLSAITRDSHREFAAYARDTLALDKYAVFDALDVVFGSTDHDYQSDHKLYADPYTGRFEPIAWSYREFHHQETFNLVENPLLLRLLLTPGYMARRDKVVYDLVTGKASASAIRDRATKIFGELAPELEADPYWDAVKLLPRASRFTRSMVRPMNTEKWLLAAADDLDDLSRRSRFLLDALEAEGFQARWRYTGEREGRIEIEVKGHAAYRLDDVVVAAGECAGSFAVSADVDRDGRLTPDRDYVVARGELGAQAHVQTYADLFSGVVLQPLEDAKPEIGKVKSVPAPRRYAYFVSSEACRPEYVAIVLHSSVTGSSSRLELPLDEKDADLGAAAPVADAASTPKLEPGDTSPHAWSLPPEPVPETVELGPGDVVVEKTRVFDAHQTVEIAPGTRLRLGPKVSLLFFGPVFAEGTLTRPIVIERNDPKRPFGGIALQGAGTAGSRFRNVEMRGGTHPTHPRIEFPAMLNIHATQDIVVNGCTLGDARDTEDVLHANTVTELRLHELEIKNAPVDAVDLEFVEADVRGLLVVAAGDDCLDLMSSRVRFAESVLLDCKNNAISAGEETELTVHNALLAESRRGVLSKNASHARLSRSLIYRAETALRTELDTVRYSGKSSIRADELFAVGCNKLKESEKGTPIDVDRFQTLMPGSTELSHLRETLHVSDWGALEQHIARLRASDEP